ncbi:unnamed protein product [Owenia fusiformis]|uniref:Uncharacterized protein n=1 Tax=Owenia fusiformis TaxID=6347 RepID=A0A8J1T5R5_OWEFU|nr:unnamed protein product [Owenia fusiformis]
MFQRAAAASRLKLLLSFAVGGLLGDVFLHLLPEAWEHIDRDRDGMHWGQMKIGLWVLTGILSFLIIEKIFAKEGEFDALEDECDEEEDTEIINNEKTNNNKNLKSNNSQIKSSYNLRQRPPIHNGTDSTSNRTKSTSNSTNSTSNGTNSTSNGTIEGIKTQKTKDGQNTQNPDSQIKVSGWLNLAANVIDNFTHGLAVAGSFSISTKVGMTTTFAILIHEVPHEVGDFAILLRSGFDRWKAAKAQLLTASGGVLGAITALAADSVQSAGDNTAWILPFTSGGFMYIALVTVVPDLLQEKHRGESLKQIFMMVLGIAIMAVVSFYH